jgi:hypothetical protein
MGTDPQIAPTGTVDWQSVLSATKDSVDEIEKIIDKRVENESIPFIFTASFAVGWRGWFGLCYPAAHGDNRSRVRKRRTSSYAPTTAATG